MIYLGQNKVKSDKLTKSNIKNVNNEAEALKATC